MSHHEDLGGDRTEIVACPLCERELVNTNLPQHMGGANCPGGDDG